MKEQQISILTYEEVSLTTSSHLFGRIAILVPQLLLEARFYP